MRIGRQSIVRAAVGVIMAVSAVAGLTGRAAASRQPILIDRIEAEPGVVGAGRDRLGAGGVTAGVGSVEDAANGGQAFPLESGSRSTR